MANRSKVTNPSTNRARRIA